MLRESFIAATETIKAPAAHLGSALKDVGIFVHEYQPQSQLRQGFKKSSIGKNCLAFSNTHIFAAQVGKAVVNVYNKEKSNQEATIPFPQKISSVAYSEQATILILGTQDGKLILWEVATGRLSTSTASHLEAISHVVVTPDGGSIVSASSDSSIHIWSIRNLVSLGGNQNSFLDTSDSKDPIATFSQHRSSIEALVVGHSAHSSTNIVVSASEDKTCYIWNLESLQVLRTILLVQVPQCAVFDPADRAVYLGSKDGSVQKIDILERQNASKSSILDNSARIAAIPMQLKATSRWSTSGVIEPGAAQCITLSYDGTTLLTGHRSGKVLQWEVAKHRMSAEFSSLSGQSVTNIQMLRPVGFLRSNDSSNFVVHTVVKPRLDLSSADVSESGRAGAVPADYVFHAQVTQSASNRAPPSDIEAAFTSPSLPQYFLDSAVQSLASAKFSNEKGQGHSGNAKNGVDMSSTEREKLEKEIEVLKSQLADQQKLDQERFDRHMARMKRREAVGLQKRQAFFAAKTVGKNGDEAMKPFMQQEKEIDAESDEEAISGGAGNTNGRQADVEMSR